MITDQRVKSFLKVQAIPLIPFHNSISFPGEKKLNLITLQNLTISFMQMQNIKYKKII